MHNRSILRRRLFSLSGKATEHGARGDDELPELDAARVNTLAFNRTT